MRPLRELAGRELIWYRPNAFSGSYELATDRHAAIVVQTIGLTRRKATIRTAEGEWTSRPVSALSRRRIIEDASGAETATLTPVAMRGAMIELADGERYRVNVGWFGGSAQLLNQMGSALATIRWRWPALRDVARVTIEPAGTAERRLGFLTAIAFLELLGRRRAAAASSGG